MFHKWSSWVRALLKLPALRTVIFHAREQSQLPGLFRHIVDVIGNPPPTVTFRYACVEEDELHIEFFRDYRMDPVYEVTRDGVRVDPGMCAPDSGMSRANLSPVARVWKSEEEMLKDMIQ